MQRTKIWFARHGEVEAPYVGSFVGKTDVGLSDLGNHQAEAIAKFLEDAEIDVIVSSPRARSQRTAAPTARDKGLETQIYEGLSEMHFGEWEGMHWPEVIARDQEFAMQWAADPEHVAIPGGENARQFFERVQAAFEQVLRDHEGKTIAIFAHSGVNRAILACMLRRPYLEMFHFAQDYGCISAGLVEGDARQIALLNLVPGPQSDDHGDGARTVA